MRYYKLFFALAAVFLQIKFFVLLDQSPDLPEEIDSEGLIYHRQRDPPGRYNSNGLN